MAHPGRIRVVRMAHPVSTPSPVRISDETGRPDSSTPTDVPKGTQREPVRITRSAPGERKATGILGAKALGTNPAPDVPRGEDAAPAILEGR